MTGETKKISPVGVIITLKDEQQVDFNKWKFTFDGKETTSTSQRVHYLAYTFEDAIRMFKQYELKEVEITWKI